jgi:hypothetical protein
MPFCCCRDLWYRCIPCWCCEPTRCDLQVLTAWPQIGFEDSTELQNCSTLNKAKDTVQQSCFFSWALGWGIEVLVKAW